MLTQPGWNSSLSHSLAHTLTLSHSLAHTLTRIQTLNKGTEEHALVFARRITHTRHHTHYSHT